MKIHKRGISFLSGLVAIGLFPLLSLFLHMSRFLVIPVALTLAAFLVLRIRKGKGFPVISVILSMAVLLWLLWAGICWPYWNSSILVELCQLRYAYAESPEKRIGSDDAMRDYETAYEHVKTVHPIFLSGGNDSFERRYRIGLSDLNAGDSVSINELHIAIQKLLATLGDGHTRAFQTYKERHAIDIGEYGIPVMINGIPIDSLLSERQDRYSSETIEYKRARLMNDIQSYEGLLFLGINPDSGVSYIFRDDNDNVREVLVNKDEFVVHNGGKRSGERAIGRYSVSRDKNMACFHLYDCECYLPWKLRNFSRHVDSFFDGIAQNGIDNVVIDLRWNPGGNPNVMKCFLRHLPLNSVDLGVRYIRRGPLLIKRKYVMDICPFSDSFRGRIYVLTSSWTFSAAMEFAYCLKRYYNAVVVGESPGNAIDCYSNMVPFVLPESNLSMSVSTTRYIREDAVANIVLPDICCRAEKAYDVVANIIAGK